MKMKKMVMNVCMIRNYVSIKRVGNVLPWLLYLTSSDMHCISNNNIVYEICERNKIKCLISAKCYWHVRKNMRPGKCNKARPRGIGKCTLECIVELDVK